MRCSWDKTMLGSLISKIKSIFQSSNQNSRHPDKHRIKKRHWCLGTVVILVGSWITHSTTATISDGMIKQPSALGFAHSGIGDFSPEAQLSKETGKSIENEFEKPADIKIEPQLEKELYTIKKGDTLGSIFKKQNIDTSLAHYISQHSQAKQLVNLSINRKLTFLSDPETKELKKIVYPVTSLSELTVNIDNGMVLDASIDELAYSKVQHEVSAEITSSLYESALEAGLSINLVMEMVRIFGWDIDFVQDIRSGDTFHVIFDDYRIDAKKVADGNILAAEFTTQNQTYRGIRFEDEKGDISYYSPNGESMLGTFLRTPVELSRISSRFGKRKHPISKKWKKHNGVDYAARTGTPIKATADGKVIHAGRKGGYGKTVILRHAGRFTTLYAHMNGYAKGVRTGSRVKQGQIIGYVGSTGYSTGPHLHYEFRVDGVHRNPLTYKTPKASSVSKESLAKFEEIKTHWVSQLDAIGKSYQLAKTQDLNPTHSQL